MDNQNELLKLCAEIMGVDADDISLDTSCDDMDELDSLTIVQIIAEMEDLFDVHISEDSLEKFKINKIGDFLKLLDNE